MRCAVLVAILCCLGLATACVRTPGGGRSQLILTSAAEENRMGAEAFAQVKAQERRCVHPPTVAFVERVGRRIAAVAPASGFHYEFVVLESDLANAFCLPGGKVAVYTGILPACVNEAGLAAVVGHEVAHAIRRHGGERLSQGLLTQLGGTVLGEVFRSRGIEESQANLMLAGAGALAQFGVILPYSRLHETEADDGGLEYMARAGYDPQEAVAFWRRFAGSGADGPAFLSTHPASRDRAAHLQAQLPRALALYAAAPVRYGQGEAVPARR